MKTIKTSNAVEIIRRKLAVIVGLPLSLTRQTGGSIRVIHFGKIVHVPGRFRRLGSVGEYAIHVQCAWRIEGPHGLVTGDGDRWHPRSGDEARPDFKWEDWNADTNGCLQDERLALLFPKSDFDSGGLMSEPDSLIVQEFDADQFGGLTIHLSGGYRVVLFPSETEAEHWRFLVPNSDVPHFVVRDNLVIDF